MKGRKKGAMHKSPGGKPRWGAAGDLAPGLTPGLEQHLEKITGLPREQLWALLLSEPLCTRRTRAPHSGSKRKETISRNLRMTLPENNL